MAVWLSLQNLDYQTTFGLFIFTLILYLYWRRRDGSKYPDGPFRFPVVGNLPQIVMCGGMANFLEKYRKLYGNVYTTEFGGAKRVVVCGYDNAQYLLVKNADYTSIRFIEAFPADHEIPEESRGIVMSSYPNWKHLRTLATNVLRNEGMGKASMEPKIMHEVHRYIEHFIEPNLGKPIDMSISISFATSNIVSHMVHGKRYEYQDPQLYNLNEAIGLSFLAQVKSVMVRNIPFASYLPGDITGRQAQEKASKTISEFGKQWLQDARTNFSAEDQNNFLHQALVSAEEDKEKAKHKSFYSDLSIGETSQQLYMAGTDTTSTAIKWALLYLLRNPEIQKKARQEVIDVLGERTVTMKDKTSLPYIDAIFHETMRCSMLLNMLNRGAEKDIMVEGKMIPAGTIILISLVSMYRDADVFSEPEIFRPERFLGEDGAARKNKILMFGTGRRVCLGEPLARMEFLLFFVTFLQRYKFHHPSGEILSEVPQQGLIRTPKNYNIIFERC